MSASPPAAPGKHLRDALDDVVREGSGAKPAVENAAASPAAAAPTTPPTAAPPRSPRLAKEPKRLAIGLAVASALVAVLGLLLQEIRILVILLPAVLGAIVMLLIPRRKTPPARPIEPWPWEGVTILAMAGLLGTWILMQANGALDHLHPRRNSAWIGLVSCTVVTSVGLLAGIVFSRPYRRTAAALGIGAVLGVGGFFFVWDNATDYGAEVEFLGGIGMMTVFLYVCLVLFTAAVIAIAAGTANHRWAGAIALAPCFAITGAIAAAAIRLLMTFEQQVADAAAANVRHDSPMAAGAVVLVVLLILAAARRSSTISGRRMPNR